MQRRGRDVCVIAPAPVEGRTVAECLAVLRGRTPVLLDDRFSSDLLDVIREERAEEPPCWDSIGDVLQLRPDVSLTHTEIITLRPEPVKPRFRPYPNAGQGNARYGLWNPAHPEPRVPRPPPATAPRTA